MDRRNFLKAMILTPTLAPFVLTGSTSSGDKQLYLISDEPENHLPYLLEKTNKQLLFSSKSMTFSNTHPRAERLLATLQKKGWTEDHRHPGVEITGINLNKPSLSSFTLVEGGKIIDLRHQELRELWIKMTRTSSSLLTIASFQPNRRNVQPGEKAAVWIGGKLIDRLPLSINIEKRYQTHLGKVVLNIKNRELSVIDSACRNKICLSSPPIRLTGERIICAPNNFMVEIQGKSPLFDTIIG